MKKKESYDEMLAHMEKLIKRYKIFLPVSTGIVVGLFVIIFFIAYMFYIVRAY